MSKVLVTESNLQDIADAIRSKNEGTDTYRPGDMAAAILAIPTGGGSTLVSKTITQNGEYDPEDDDADGYSDVTVNVPNSYTAGDEGKVVSSGALVAQTSRSVTENGTYDTTENDEVVVNVSGGGGGSTNILSGTDAPVAAEGSNGDIYLQYNEVPEIPSGYTPLDYIAVESAGPYIDTGVQNTSNAYFEIVAQYTAQPSNNYGIFGAQTSIEFTINNYGGVVFMNIGGAGRTVVPSATILEKHKYEAKSSGTSIDDGDVTGPVNWNNATGRNYYIMAINYTGGVLKTANTRVFSCKIWNGETLVRNFVPAKRNTDDAIGLYDVVNNVFYENSGTGTFSGQESGSIFATYAKVNSAWQNLIGTDIDDVDTSGSINLQSKTVTENGTVTPDTGYDGLSSVVVNVPGGGGGETATIAVENGNLITNNVTVNTQPVITDDQIGASASEGMTFSWGAKLYIEFDLTIKLGGSVIVLSFGGSNTDGGVYCIDTQGFELYAKGTKFRQAITLTQNVKYRIKLLLETNSATLYVDGAQIAVGQSNYVWYAIAYIIKGNNVAVLFNQSAHSEYNSSLIDNISIHFSI